MTIVQPPRVGPPREPKSKVSSRTTKKGLTRRITSMRESMAAIDNLGRKSLVFMLGFALYGSLSPWGRPEVAGFLLHPFLVVLAIMLIMSGLRSLRNLPRRFGTSFFAYIVIFTVLSMQGGLQFVEPIKVIISFFAIAAIVAVLRDRGEVILATAGAMLAVGLAGVPAILDPVTSVVGAEGLAGGFGNKNSYSLYALPIILVATHFAMDSAISKRMRWLLVIGAGLAAIAILSSGNRSGYLGLAIVGMLLVVRRKRLRDAIIVSVAGAVVFLLLSTLGSSAAFWFRISNPETSQRSDAVRVDIISHATRIGMRSPIVGVGPPNVAENIAISVGHGSGTIVTGKLDAHNLFAYNFAGGGFTLLLSLIAFMAVMVMRPPEWPHGVPPSERAESALKALQGLVILFAIRGWFSEDAFTTPGFPIAMGLLIALVQIETRVALANNHEQAVESAVAADRHLDLFAQERARRTQRRQM